MKIDQGFTERLSSQTSRINSSNDAAQGTGVSSRLKNGSSDQLQLSSIASRLQSATTTEATASSHASRLSQLAQLVNSGQFQIDPSKISGALISEAVQTAGR